jgi:folate receptor
MQKCEKFLIEEECFFQCEPRLFRWHVKGTNATIKGVPICGDYCDDWYDACKEDETCAKDWVVGFNSSNNMYTCPRGSECKTFKQVR